MTTTTVEQHEFQQQGDWEPSRDVFQAISASVSQCRNAPAFYRDVLQLYAEHFQTHFATMSLCNAAESLDDTMNVGESSSEAWERLTQDIMLESQADGVALAKLYDIDGTNARVAMIAVPLRDDLNYRGAIALIVTCCDREHAESLLFELRSLSTLACSLASNIRRPQQQAMGDTDGVVRALARAARYGTSTELAFAITNGLKTKFECNQVVLGKVRRGRVQLLSLSGMDALYPRSPGTRLIRQAMEECLDSSSIIQSKPGNEWSESSGKRDYRLHRQWRATIGDAAVASVPLTVDDKCVAILSLVRPGDVGFQGEELNEVAQLAGAYAPALQLVARAGRSWVAQARDTLHEGLMWLVARNRWGRRMVAATIVAAVVWFFSGTWDYRLSTPCQLVPTRLHHCVAPYDGTIHSAYVEVGDHVKAGQLLYAMDARELELQVSELELEASVIRLEISQAAASQDFPSAAMARARLQVALARLDGLKRKIEMSQVRAPTDGTVMAGTVERRVGEVVQMGEPLLEFAPRGAWVVEMRVNSRDAQLVAGGQVGRFVTLARPDEVVHCRVKRIEPAATVVEGKTVYIARAHITSDIACNLAGMDGIATLDVGRRRVWWVVLHRAIDFARLKFWI